MNAYAQETRLRLKTKVGANQKTIIEDMFFTPPLKIIQPIYEEVNGNEIANIMLLSVSAGLMNGDSQILDIDIQDHSRVHLTSQSFEKIHDTQEGKATRCTNIKLHPHSFLNFNPLPVIPFANSSFENFTRIDLCRDSRLCYGEIFCAGRVSRGEIFHFKIFHSNLKIYQEGKLIFLDNTFLDPKTQDLKNCCNFGDFTHYLNLIFIDPNLTVENVREKLHNFDLIEKINVGVSQNNQVIILKALAYESEVLLALREMLGKDLS